MFQLIVTVISIALIATLAVATLWFGGVAFTGSGDKVDYTKTRNGAFQIETALNMHFGDKGTYPSGTSTDILNALMTQGYLTALPPGDFRIENNQIVRTLTTQAECYKLNKLSGVTTTNECPPCADTAKSNYIACEQ